jgi:protein O-GlcNAc transferase
VAYQSWGGWRDLRSRDGTAQGRIWPDTLIWDKIRDDQIDILVDLSGYTSCNALPVFCYKPAPIQITGWGYATGVGWKAMDYLMTDRVVVPEDRQDEHVERMLYMPCVINYEPMDGFPVQPNPLPCLTERPTFGVFQRSLKLNADEFEVWRQILERLPESRLLFKSHYPQSLVDWVKPHFGAQAHQVEFQFATSALDHKKAYAQVDLSLDCWPQTGGVSSCDSLWMGAPMVTLLGDRVIQRTSASLLTILGLTDFIVDTREQYIDTAVEWVTTRKHELATIRAGLRDQCDASPIRQGYLEATERVYRQAWRDWCAKPLSLADARYRLEQAS